jgi:Ca2+-transporting ATPase
LTRRAIPTAERPIIQNWHEQTGASVLTQLQASADGLTSAEAAARLALHGPNQLTDAARAGMLRILISQFRSVILWLLIGAALVSVALGETSDGAMILGIVLLNAAIGFMQEYGAARSITALTKLTAPVASVRRDGKVVVLPAAQLVEGDVLSLAAGDVVAATSSDACSCGQRSASSRCCSALACCVACLSANSR